MSYVLNVNKTFAKAVDDLVLGITVVQENDDFDPPSSGRWIEMSMISHDLDPMSKGAEYENSGVCQLSVFDADTGTLQSATLTLIDTLAAEFTHGKSYNHYGDTTVFIDRLSISEGGSQGRAFYQKDLSINWKSYE